MTINQKHIDCSFWIKVYALLLVTFGFTLVGVAQSTFSKIINAGGNGLFSCVEEIDDHLYVSGGFKNPQTGFSSSSYLYKLDNTAELIDSIVNFDPSIEWRTRRNNLQLLSDSTLLWAHSLYIEAHNEIVVHRLDLELNKIDSVAFSSPVEEPFDPLSENMDLSANTMLGDTLYMALNLFSEGKNILGVIRIEPNLDTMMLFTKQDGITHNAMALARFEDKLLVADATGSLDGYFGNLIIFHLTNSQILTEIEYDLQGLDHSLNIREFIPLPDGFIGSGAGRHPDWNYSQPMLFKLNKQGETLWWTLPNSRTLGTHGLQAIDQTCDGGFIGFADWTVEIIEEDTVMSSDQTELLGIRYDSSGEILWERTFRFVDGQLVEHLPADVIATEDGGFVVVGHVSNSDLSDPENTFPFQRNLIFKVDACGCLVPGCDPLCELGDCKPEETWESEDQFMIGPNPTSDLVNLFLAPSDSRSNERVQIHDVTGKVIHDFSVSENGTTYMIDMSDEAPGIYVVSLRSELGIMQSERFIVE